MKHKAVNHPPNIHSCHLLLNRKCEYQIKRYVKTFNIQYIFVSIWSVSYLGYAVAQLV